MKSQLALLAVGAAAAVAATPAAAVDAAKPTPCTGLHLADKKGDSLVTPFGIFGDLEHEGPPNSDITGVFLNYKPDKAGKPVLTVNIQLVDANMEVPPLQDSSGGLAYYAHWSFNGESVFVRAHNQTGSELTFGWGKVTSEGVYEPGGDTVGAMFEGPDGIVQIDIPAEIGGKPGSKLTGLLANVDGFYGGPDDITGFNNHFDQAPNGADVITPNGKTYTVVECPAGGGAPAGPDQPPTGGGTGNNPSSGGSGGGQQQGEALPLRVNSTLGSARKAKRKTLKFRATASKAITGLRVALVSSKGKVVAKGALARMEGTKTLKLKFSKKPRKGSYTFTAQGTVDGQQRNLSKRVKLKR